MLIASLLPLLGGALIPALRFKSRKGRTAWVEGVMILTSLMVLRLILRGTEEVTLIAFSRAYRLSFGLDGMGRVFLGLMAFLWPLAALYASEYMQHEEREDSFFAFYTMTFGVMILYCCARNMFTLYVLFECITLVTLPLVWHKKDAPSIRAARAYIRYSIGCAAFAFAALIVVSQYASGDFQLGGLDLSGMPKDLMCAAFLACFFGFGVKAAVFPLSAWLPRACAAPTPVTALLHAVAVVNAGVYAVLRMVYNVFGAALQGTWAQTVALIFSILTILFGAVMAVRERHVKRKLAYSTVSNLGYMLLGASIMTPAGQLGSLMHMVCHGLMKITLFFCIGAVMVQTGRTQTRQMQGLAKRMPLVFTAFTVAAIALMGIPPLCGFISKVYLATAALEMGNGWGVAGVAALLISSVLTAIYSLSVALPAFFMPLDAAAGPELPDRCDPGLRMLVPLGLLLCAVLLLGACSQPLADALRVIAGM